MGGMPRCEPKFFGRQTGITDADDRQATTELPRLSAMLAAGRLRGRDEEVKVETVGRREDDIQDF